MSRFNLTSGGRVSRLRALSDVLPATGSDSLECLVNTSGTVYLKATSGLTVIRPRSGLATSDLLN